MTPPISRALQALLAVTLLGSPLAAQAAGEPLRRPEGPEMGYDDGFFLRSSDGAHELKVEGLFQVLGRYNGRRRTPDSEFELKRMRPEFAGRIADHYRFKLEPKFDEDGVELEEAWAGMEMAGDAGLLMFGRMKAPFGLEEVRSRRHIPFSFFSILNQFSPAEQHGVFLNGMRDKLEYGFAAYNGGGGDEHDRGKEVAARAMWHPFKGDFGTTLEALQFGAAMTYGRESRSLAGESIRTASHLPLMDYESSTRLDGDQWRLGLEGAWYDGPYMAQAEVLYMRQELEGAGARGDVDHWGAYLGAWTTLTGEDVSFSGISPRNAFRSGHPGEEGALVLASRISYLHSDRALRDNGWLVPNGYTEGITSLWLGLNWYLSEHAMLRNGYVHSFYSDSVGVDGSAARSEGAFLIEFQLHF